MVEYICPKCGKVETLTYKASWHRLNKGTGFCNSCSKKGGNKFSFKKGTTPWNKGLNGFNKGHPPYFIAHGKDNPSWKDKGFSYTALHQWVFRHAGKAKVCVFCGFTGKCSWANIDHLYKRELKDFISLCYSCHKKYDRRCNCGTSF